MEKKQKYAEKIAEKIYKKLHSISYFNVAKELKQKNPELYNIIIRSSKAMVPEKYLESSPGIKEFIRNIRDTCYLCFALMKDEFEKKKIKVPIISREAIFYVTEELKENKNNTKKMFRMIKEFDENYPEIGTVFEILTSETEDPDEILSAILVPMFLVKVIEVQEKIWTN